MPNFISRLKEGNPRSITAMLLAVMSFSGDSDTLIKVLAERYPPIQIAALRGGLSLPLIVLWIHWRGAWPEVMRARRPLHQLRGAPVIAMLVLFTVGVRGLPLTHAYTLMFFAPLLITALAGRCSVSRRLARTGGSGGHCAAYRGLCGRARRVLSAGPGWQCWVPQCATPCLRW